MAQRLGGWWRLWVVISVVFGAAVFAINFNPNPAKLEWSEQVPDGVKVDYEKWRDDRLAGRKCAEGFTFPLDLSQRDTPNSRVVTMWCTPTPNYLKPLGFALIPGALLLIVGLTFAWVWAGFRSRQQTPES